MCELMENHGRLPEKVSWVTLCTLIALVLGPSTLAVFATYDVNRENQPSDEQLAIHFFSHEAGFDELVHMLAADHLSLAANRATGIDLAAVARLDKDTARLWTYRGLLRQISVADFRYFPDSGKLALVPDGQENPQRPSKSYLYLPRAQPQSLVQHHGHSWREPGIFILTGDHPLKGRWFIHHETTIRVAVTSY